MMFSKHLQVEYKYAKRNHCSYTVVSVVFLILKYNLQIGDTMLIFGASNFILCVEQKDCNEPKKYKFKMKLKN
jgi:hypothetical protein